jgi:hypothetical protein
MEKLEHFYHNQVNFYVINDAHNHGCTAVTATLMGKELSLEVLRVKLEYGELQSKLKLCRLLERTSRTSLVN